MLQVDFPWDGHDGGELNREVEMIELDLLQTVEDAFSGAWVGEFHDQQISSAKRHWGPTFHPPTPCVLCVGTSTRLEDISKLEHSSGVVTFTHFS
jgi:hypothetical protein